MKPWLGCSLSIHCRRSTTAARINKLSQQWSRVVVMESSHSATGIIGSEGCIGIGAKACCVAVILESTLRRRSVSMAVMLGTK